MNKHVRQILLDAKRLAEAHGVSVRLEPGGKHQHLILEGRGTRRLKPVAKSPSGDAVQFARLDVRRLLREMVGV